MKGRAIGLVVILCIASLAASAVNARGKPDRPGGSRPEEIEFTGDLAGWQLVEDCCPNAGPMPEYMMTLGGDLCDSSVSDCTYNGRLFINYYGAGQDRRYVVQFWSESLGTIEIIGGVIYEDRRNKSTRVVFTHEVCYYRDSGDFIAFVNFELTRTR